ncbi:hypothetical protein ACLKA6_000697 [Drosophila palustris]
MARQLSERLDAACDSSMPRRKPSRRGSPCYWWNDQIAQLRKACLRARRCSQRARRRPDFEDRLEDLRAAKRALKHAIKAKGVKNAGSSFEDAAEHWWTEGWKAIAPGKSGCVHPSVRSADLGKGGGEQQGSPEETLSTVQALRSASHIRFQDSVT